ncbi:MAG TPA: hypothetical protein VN516_00650, partial [Candidatus Baltobacteraceae bacterium]|nr:hypothetical protein [Candidatus Baltobacteraceae bacterium]
PIITGKYSFWSYEILAWPKSGQFGTYTDQNITFNTLNTILNKLAGYNSAGTTFVGGVGSIDNEILLSQLSGASAVRLGDMLVSRAAVGGHIAP